MKALPVNPNRKREKKKTGLLVIAVAVLVLCGVIGYSRQELLREKNAREKQYMELLERYMEEQERSDYLTERRAYMQTPRYIEEMARQKLGLVYKDEIIFRPSDTEKEK